MKKHDLLGASILALMIGTPAFAQDAALDEDMGEIIVTAQRQNESLQSVPIAVSAFSAEALEKQQIKNSSDLQLTLPNVTFSKTNFTSSSFTIRGVGDLCVGAPCDQATAIHMNGSPIPGTRLFETEFFDLERIEVLRGPQGTLFGRNATSGVVNVISAKPDLSGFHAAGEAEYGNYDAIKVKGMVNAPIGDKIGVRLAGFYLKRDGYTTNLYTNSKVDGRDMFGVRGSIRFQPTETTTLDLMGYYFREKDNRSRIQKQMCQRDPTGVLGCLPGKREFGQLNGNATIPSLLTSRELLTLNTAAFRTSAQGNAVADTIVSLALGSLYGPDVYAGFVNPADYRTVNMDFSPEYFTDEKQFQAHLDQELGSLKLGLTGMYHTADVDSRADYNQSVQSGATFGAPLATLRAIAAGAGGPISPYFAPLAAAVSPTAGTFCTSDTEKTGTGAYGGFKNCASTPLDYDRSNLRMTQWNAEAILSSDFDGKFNFLVGGIYLDQKVKDNNYFVTAFGLDYAAGILGAATALGNGLAPGYLGTPFYRSNSELYGLKSYGLFGEAYIDFTDKLKLTAGLRYNSDKKSFRARTTLLAFYVPASATDAFATPRGAGFDADPGTICPTTNPATLSQSTTTLGAIGSAAGCEAYDNTRVSFNELTGRAVLDYKISDDHLLYLSYSRGYKSGGINPPLSPIFQVAKGFEPETIDSFEIGSKNTFAGGLFRLNATAFYYKYKGLQLSRIVARTSVNDNVDADIYGVELEGIIKPSRSLLVNLGFSYLHTKVASDKFLGDPRDPSGGRADAVIIKDVTNGSNCAVVPTTAGNAVGTNTLVGAINGSIGLRAPTAFPTDSGIRSTGAFGVCSALQGAIANPSAGLRALFATPTGALPFAVETAGVPVNIRGNTLPQAPTVKWNVGVQYTGELSNGMTIVPRADLVYTGDQTGNIFNGNVNRIQGYSQINAQLQVNGRDDRWFVRGWIQNVTNSNAVTGLYVTDQSSGLFTNVFTLEPRRYGLTAGFKF